MKPPFAYFGGKTVLAPRIAALLPEHRHYVEPFDGSLAVLLAKPPSKLVDPPYEGVTRPRTYDGYRHEMRATADHQALADALLACKASVVLSGYRSPLYDEMYGAWDAIDIPTFTGQGTGDITRTEVLWSNRPVHAGRLFGMESGWS